MFAVVAAVTKPFAFTVVFRNVPILLFTVASVSAALTLAEPFTAVSVAVASPVSDRSRAVAQVVAVPALPDTLPVIVFENVFVPPTVCVVDRSTYAPLPAMAMIEVAEPPEPPVPVP
jgi:hypothetical protein